MFTQRNSHIVFMMMLALSITACTGKNAYSADVEGLDGTWVDVKEYRSSPAIRDREYSWGVGKRIVETTLEIEIEKKKVLMPGTGLFFIQRISKESNSSILVDIKGPGEEGGWKMRLIFHFLDRDTLWIECTDLEGMFSVGKNKPWYRLSGPSR